MDTEMSELCNQTINSHRQAAVFLDRDGTIIEDRGNLADPSEVVFFPETFEALSALQKHFRLFIVTNQSGVAKGHLSMDAVQRVNRHVIYPLVFLAYGISGVVGPTLGGLLFENTGSYLSSIILAAAVACVGAAMQSGECPSRSNHENKKCK